jgi:tRNA pseudouridine38-40 synthase
MHQGAVFGSPVHRRLAAPGKMALVEDDVRRARMTVAYDGSAFHGFARNEGVATVAGRLGELLETICRRPVELVGAGRTDAGVHAWGQVVSGDLPADIDLTGVRNRVNSMGGPAIVVRDIEWAPTPDFSARFDARWRHYRYTVLNTPVPNPFLATTAWHVVHPLDLRLMQLACDPFVGEHDFTSFCRKPKVEEGEPEAPMRRRILQAEWSDVGGGCLRFDVRANAFCHQMVRSITGTLVEVGQGKRHAGDVMGILRARDRNRAGQVAPPHGLCLWEVGYDE